LHPSYGETCFSIFFIKKETKNEIFEANDYAIIISSYGKTECQNVLIIDVYLVPILSASLLFVYQLNHIFKNAEFLLGHVL
jgi:hypothetical protein